MPSPVNRVEALRGAVRAGDDAALAHLAELTLRHADDPAVRAAALQAAVAGSREAELFAQLIGPAGHDSRDLGGVLREFAAAAGRTGRPDAALSVVREVSGRECCLRRSLLTGSLDGLSEGLAAVRFAPVRQAEAAMRLAELAANHDPEVARAARRAAAFFVLPERRP